MQQLFYDFKDLVLFVPHNCMLILFFISDSLQGYFSQFGEISDCIIMTNPDTGKSRGFGFISFKDPDTVDIILSTTNHAVDGRKVCWMNTWLVVEAVSCNYFILI